MLEGKLQIFPEDGGRTELKGRLWISKSILDAEGSFVISEVIEAIVLLHGLLMLLSVRELEQSTSRSFKKLL